MTWWGWILIVVLFYIGTAFGFCLGRYTTFNLWNGEWEDDEDEDGKKADILKFHKGGKE